MNRISLDNGKKIGGAIFCILMHTSSSVSPGEASFFLLTPALIIPAAGIKSREHFCLKSFFPPKLFGWIKFIGLFWNSPWAKREGCNRSQHLAKPKEKGNVPANCIITKSFRELEPTFEPLWVVHSCVDSQVQPDFFSFLVCAIASEYIYAMIVALNAK